MGGQSHASIFSLLPFCHQARQQACKPSTVCAKPILRQSQAKFHGARGLMAIAAVGTGAILWSL
jgi:hypothetical protein